MLRSFRLALMGSGRQPPRANLLSYDRSLVFCFCCLLYVSVSVALAVELGHRSLECNGALMLAASLVIDLLSEAGKIENRNPYTWL